MVNTGYLEDGAGEYASSVLSVRVPDEFDYGFVQMNEHRPQPRPGTVIKTLGQC